MTGSPVTMCGLTGLLLSLLFHYVEANEDWPRYVWQVMTNLYHEVASRIYKLQTPPLIRDRRHGRPRQQHNTHMCEGCRQGLCKTTKTQQPVTATQT